MTQSLKTSRPYFNPDIMLKYPFSLTLLLGILISGCQPDRQKPLDGRFRAVLTTPGGPLPFWMDFRPAGEKLSLVIRNGEESIEVPEITRKDNDLTIMMPVFDSHFDLTYRHDSLVGFWQNSARGHDYRIPFYAVKDSGSRFAGKPLEPAVDITGRWSVTFVDMDNDTTLAIGEFEQDSATLTGTFLTPTGDYRYLEGRVKGDSMFLSCFDGAHAFLFTALIPNESIMMGKFWSGKHWEESWVAQRNDSARLPDPYELTYIKDGYDGLAFRFPDLDSNMVSLSDDQYRNKVVIVQIMGSWCPNCKDETAFLADYYREHSTGDLKIIALAFEKAKTFKKASRNVARLRDQYRAGYDFLIAGPANKKEAVKKLPMLNHVLSYPTTIFIDKAGNVRKIHTGFSGPATGAPYDQFKREFEEMVGMLLEE